MKYIIEDASHCQHMGEFGSFEAALERLKVWSKISWDQEPN